LGEKPGGRKEAAARAIAYRGEGTQDAEERWKLNAEGGGSVSNRTNHKIKLER
jgi:hypothetical protein